MSSDADRELNRAAVVTEQQYRNATAYVYWGAAFLVLMLGGRALMESYGIGEEYRAFVAWLAGAALFLEFFLLLYYGRTIKTYRDNGNGKAQSSDFAGSVTDLSEIRETARALQEAARALDAAKGSLVEIAAAANRAAVYEQMIKVLNQTLDAAKSARQQ